MAEELTAQELIAQAPARIDFGGGWTDVPPYPAEQGGCVCNLAITRRATVRLAPHAGVAIEEEGARVAAASLALLPAEVARSLPAAALRRARIDGISVTLRSDFPVGAGLGGSSAAGVAMAAALAAWTGESPARSQLAERSRTVEVEELGVAGGKQDHYAAAFGGALGLWFGDEVTVRPLPLAPELVAELERRCIVVYTGLSRMSGETITAVMDAYRAREPRVTAALARMGELAEQMIVALEQQSVDDLGALVAEHWVHQRALHPGITTPEIERVLEMGHRAGAVGGKALGASGGGCVLVIAAAGREMEVRHSVAAAAQLLPFGIDTAGVRLSRPGEEPAGRERRPGAASASREAGMTASAGSGRGAGA